MEYTQKEITIEDAKIIAGWRYPEPYNLYNMGESEEAVYELMSSEYSAVYSKGRLFGFYCTGDSARIPIKLALPIYQNKIAVDIGLGICPDMTGSGLGRSFFRFVLDRIKKDYPNSVFRLTVADFNKRAIKVYKALGFIKSAEFTRDSNGVKFIVMMLKE